MLFNCRFPDTMVIEMKRTPKVARNYQREDFSELACTDAEFRKRTKVGKAAARAEKAVQTARVSPEKRRRDSLMSNRAMRHAYSSVEKRIHDRDCAEVSKIPDAEFEMLTEYRTDLKRCWLCGRRAIVRAGISCDDAQHMDAYMDLLRRFGAMTGELYALIVVNHAQLLGVKQDSVCIRCGEDTWMLCGDQAELSLYHNNYEVLENYERLLKLTFHLQQTRTQPLPDQSDAPLFVARARGAVQSGRAGAKAGRTSRTLPASSQCGSSKALVAAVLFLYGSRLCREAVYVLCGKQGTSGDSCSGDKPPFLPNLALPCAPLGSEAAFESSGTAEGR